MRYRRRLVNPLRRLAVTLRYGGIGAARDLVTQRYREVRAPASGSASPDPFEQIAVQAITLPAAPRESAPDALPAVSVIVRTHDRPAFLGQALTSLANQTFTDFEVVVVNDGESSVADVITRLLPYVAIRQADHPAGRGRTVALNSGLAAACGRWITYLDDDDIVYPMHLETLVNALSDGRAQAAYTDANRALCWSDQQRTETVVRMGCGSTDFDQRRMLVDNWIASVAFMHCAACVEHTGAFDEEFEPFEDWESLIRLGANCTFAHVPVTTYEYRVRFGPIPANTQSVLRQRERVLETTQRVYARYPAPPGELQARRRLTLAALEQDIEEVCRIEQTVSDPLHRDLLIMALIGRFPISPTLLRRYVGQT